MKNIGPRGKNSVWNDSGQDSIQIKITISYKLAHRDNSQLAQKGKTSAILSSELVNCTLFYIKLMVK